MPVPAASVPDRTRVMSLATIESTPPKIESTAMRLTEMLGDVPMPVPSPSGSLGDVPMPVPDA